MNDSESIPESEPGDPQCDLVERMRRAAPARLPEALKKRLQTIQVEPQPPPQAPVPVPLQRARWITPLAASIALAAALLFKKDGPEPADLRPRASAQTALSERLLRVEHAGTAESTERTYQIVRLTILHQLWGDAEGLTPRLLSEDTSEQFVALPLEVF